MAEHSSPVYYLWILNLSREIGRRAIWIFIIHSAQSSSIHLQKTKSNSTMQSSFSHMSKPFQQHINYHPHLVQLLSTLSTILLVDISCTSPNCINLILSSWSLPNTLGFAAEPNKTNLSTKSTWKQILINQSHMKETILNSRSKIIILLSNTSSQITLLLNI